LHFYQSLSGTGFFPESRLTDSALQELWQEWHTELLALHIGCFPGSRPYAWWNYEAPEPRQRIDGLPHPFTDVRYPAHSKVLSYGKPRYLFVLGDEEEEFESQADYLKRLKLLTGEELRRLRAVALPQWDAPGEPRLSLETVRLWWQEVTG
jgi:hypothetical protein